jgi:hypothetical protein
MHCVVLSSPTTSSWHIKRSVEVLAYHLDEKRVSILLLLLAQNHKEGEPLTLLHRGNISCVAVPAWPLPLHENEEADSRAGVLAAIYADFFRETPEGLYKEKDLSAWDSEIRLRPGTRESVWASDQSGPLPSVFGDTSPCEWVPFTTWSVKPGRSGWNLFAFRLSFEGETFSRLLPRERVFTVDGPDRLLERIEYEDFARLSENERALWCKRLHSTVGDSKQKRLHCESYDLVLLGQPFADDVQVNSYHCSTGVYPAPIQPRGFPGTRRFLTNDPLFTLPLSRARVNNDRRRISSSSDSYDSLPAIR